MLKQNTESMYNIWKITYLHQIKTTKKEISGEVKRSQSEIDWNELLGGEVYDPKERLTEAQNNLEELEESKRKWDGITEWLIECLKGKSKKIPQIHYRSESNGPKRIVKVEVLGELGDAIDFEKLKCYSKESKHDIIKRIQKNLNNNLCFRKSEAAITLFHRPNPTNSGKEGQYNLKRLDTIFNDVYKKLVSGKKVDFTDKNIHSLQVFLEHVTRKISTDQRTFIRKSVGIGSHWNKKLCWDFLECHNKITGLVPTTGFENQEKKLESIKFCVDAIINSVKQEEITFDAAEINLLTINMKDLLCEQLLNGKKTYDKSLLNFSRSLKQHLENECEFNFKRLDKQTVDKLFKKLEETQTDWGKIQYLFKKEGQFWIARGIEKMNLEFKASFFHDEKRSKGEFDAWVAAINNKAKAKKQSAEKELSAEKKLDKLEKEMAKQYKITKKPEKLAEFFKEKQNFVETRILKNVCSFINTDGGKVIIGALDDGTLAGLDSDCKHAKYQIKDQRKFLEKMSQKWVSKIKTFEEYQNYIALTPIQIKNSKKWIYLIEISLVPDMIDSKTGAYLVENKKSVFYVRDGGDGTIGYDYDGFMKWKRHYKDFPQKVS